MTQQTPYVSQIVIAKYRQPDLPEHRGNPLIEAIPPFRTAEEILPTFGKFPVFNKKDRAWSRSSRMLAISRLDNYLEPLTCHKEVIEQISLMIHAGYRYRNPATAQYRKALVEFYRQSMEGPIRPIQPSVPSTARALSLFGVSGVGKSSVVERTLSYLPQAIVHPKYGLEPQIVWLKLDCPLDGSLKQLLIQFISQVDQTLNTTYAELTKRAGVDELIVIVAKIAAKHHLGLFVVDEIQNLLVASGVGPAKMLNFFVTFVNVVKVPLFVLGTLKAQRFLRKLFREARRLSDSGSVVWDRLQQGDEWDFFLKELCKYQWTLKPVNISEAHLSKVIYFHTQGIHALVVRLFQLSQLRAIRDGTERLTAPLIQQIALKQFTLLKPALEALQSGKATKIEKLEDLISDGLEALKSQVEADDKLAALEEMKSGERKLKTDRIRLMSNLVTLGMDGKKAQHAVDTLFSTGRLTEARREQIISRIAEGNLRRPEESLIELFEEAKVSGADVPSLLVRAKGAKAR